MGKPIILLSSVTYAMRGRDLLMRYGKKAYVERVASNGKTGCGYGLYVPKDVDEAEKILKENGIRVLGRAERDGRK